MRMKIATWSVLLYVWCSAISLPAQDLIAGRHRKIFTSSSMTVNVTRGGTGFPLNFNNVTACTGTQFFTSGGYGYSTPATPEVTGTTLTFNVFTCNTSASALHVGLVSDNGNTPGGGTMQCQGSESSVAVAGWQTVVLTGCSPGTVIGTRLHLAIWSPDTNLIFAGTTGNSGSPVMQCDRGSLQSFYTNSTMASFPINGATWPAATQDDVCYAISMTQSYTTTASFAINQVIVINGYLNNAAGTYEASAASFGAGHTIVAAFTGYTEGHTVTSYNLADSNGDTFTGALRQGNCLTAIASLLLDCAFSKEGISSGNKWFGISVGGSSEHGMLSLVEIQKNGGTATYDTGSIDSTAQGTPFTGTSFTLSTAPEFSLCWAFSSNGTVAGSPPTWTAGGSWNYLTSGQATGSSGATFYPNSLFQQTFATSGSKTCQGSSSVSATTYYTMSLSWL